MFSRGTLERKGLKKGSSGCRLQIFNVCLTILWALGITYKAKSLSRVQILSSFILQIKTKQKKNKPAEN